MATGMFGANTEVLRQVGKSFNTHSRHVEEARRRTVFEVQGVTWEGPDAEAFKQYYADGVGKLMGILALTLQAQETDVDVQADAQDECSSGNGAGGDAPWWRRALDALRNGVKDLASDARDKLRDLVKTIRDRVSFDGSGPAWGWSVKIPWISDGINRQAGKEFKDDKWQDASPEDKKKKTQIGASGFFDLFRRDMTIDMPGDKGSLNVYSRAGADGFIGYDRTEKEDSKKKGEMKVEHKVGAEAGASIDLGGNLTMNNGGYLDLSLGAEASAGAGAELKAKVGHDDGKVGASARAKAALIGGGGGSIGLSYDARSAMNDARNNPGQFAYNSVRDLGLVNPTVNAALQVHDFAQGAVVRMAGAGR